MMEHNETTIKEDNHSATEPTSSVVEPTFPTKRQEEQISKYLIPLSVILGSLIIAAAILYTKPATQALPGVQQPQQVAVSIEDVNTDNVPFIGKADAPVTIAYWTDYQCPFCKKLEVETLPGVLSNYVEQGKVKIVFKDFQFLGPDSMTAALFAHSIWKNYPQQYFTWREAVFAAQDDENAGFGDQASIVALTKTIPGIDTTKIEQDIVANIGTYEKIIEADRIEGQQYGIQGTPALIIGENLIPGAISFNELKPLIEAELK